MTSEIVRFQVGDFSCLVLADGETVVTEKLITHIFAKQAEPMLAVFRSLREPLISGMNILLVERSGKRTLVDTGSGYGNPSRPGQLLARLHAATISLESIDTVILTHYHWDHLGGLLDKDGNRAFSRARLVAPRQEHEYWMRPETLATLDTQRSRLLRRVAELYEDRLTLNDTTTDIEPGIRYLPARGHTPGHCALNFESRGEKLLHLGDIFHLPLQINAVEVSPSFDSQPDIAVLTRRAALEHIATEKPLVMAYHFPYPGLGYVQRQHDVRTWMPYSIPVHE